MLRVFSYRSIYLIIVAVIFLFVVLTETEGKNLLPDDEQYLVIVEKAPAPIGGAEAIIKKINYPEAAIKAKIEGKIYSLVYIDETGNVDEVKVIKGLGNGCDEEAIKAIKKTKFSPGMEKGTAVKTKFSLAIQFKLP